MSAQPKLVLAGIVGRYPVGGVTWCALQYIAGFQALGYDVTYLEDTGECNFDPSQNAIATEPDYALAYLREELARVGLQDDWCYVDYRGDYHGMSRAAIGRVCRDADLMVNLSGGCWFARPEYDALPRVFVDTDPGFTQQAVADAGNGWYREFLASHRALFTFALAVGREDCALADTPFTWHPTVQPVHLDFWPVSPPPPDGPFTTIMSWTIDSFPGMGKGKGDELLRLVDLPSRSRQRILLALAGQPPTEELERHGWELADAVHVTRDTDAYRRFVQGSRGELGFAKAMYVETRSGWFSDRTQCYLASGRPALVRETGFSHVLPTGEGLLSFESMEGIVAGLDELAGDIERHGRAARALAREHFAADRVLAALLEVAGAA